MKKACFRFWMPGLLFFSVFVSRGQSAIDENLVAEKYWSIDLGAGAVIMPNTSSSPLLSKRPSLGFHQDYSFNYAFADKWAVYAGFGFNYYASKRPQILDTQQIGIHVEDIVEGLFGKIESIKPSFDAGLMYRFQMNRWELLPKLGLSYTVNDWDRNRQFTLKESGVKLRYKMKGAVPGVQVGLNSHYWISTTGYLHFGLLAEHPLQKPYGEAIYLRGTEPMSSTKSKATGFGQNLYAQVGYGFVFRKN